MSSQKVFLLNMSIDNYGNNVDLVKWMQVGDMENAWMMFNRVKHVEGWTTMVCHVYDLMYYEVMIITMYECNQNTWKPNVSWGPNLTMFCSSMESMKPISKGSWQIMHSKLECH